MQNAAYSTMLRGRRQQLHSAIAQALEERFPGLVYSTPEAIAQQFERVGQNEKAIQYWLRAGDRDLRRFAMKESITHYSNALRLVTAMPSTPERSGLELGVCLGLGLAQQIGIGPTAKESGVNYQRALTLSRTLPGRGRERFLATWGVWFHTGLSGRSTEALTGRTSVGARQGSTRAGPESREGVKRANQGVELVDGDWNDSAAIERALKGVEGAFVMLPAVWAPSPDYKEAKGVIANYVEALTKAAPPRVVALSSMGANRTSGLGMITALSLLEQGFRDLISPIAFVRAGGFFENFLYGLQVARAERYRSTTIRQTGNRPWSRRTTSARRSQPF